jgi:hypothetical protein
MIEAANNARESAQQTLQAQLILWIISSGLQEFYIALSHPVTG